MQIERHRMPDGAEQIIKRVMMADSEKQMRRQMMEAHDRAMENSETLEEIKQVRFDPEDPCPCGSRKKAKNCCAGRLLRRLEHERFKKERKGSRHDID